MAWHCGPEVLPKLVGAMACRHYSKTKFTCRSTQQKNLAHQSKGQFCPIPFPISYSSSVLHIQWPALHHPSPLTKGVPAAKASPWPQPEEATSSPRQTRRHQAQAVNHHLERNHLHRLLQMLCNIQIQH
jgi:hypothetical protein